MTRQWAKSIVCNALGYMSHAAECDMCKRFKIHRAKTPGTWMCLCDGVRRKHKWMCNHVDVALTRVSGLAHLDHL